MTIDSIDEISEKFFVAANKLLDFPSADAIAEALAEKGIKGKCKLPSQCAVTEFYYDAMGVDEAERSRDWYVSTSQHGTVLVADGRGIASVDYATGGPVFTFVLNFDDRVYPQLVAEGA